MKTSKILGFIVGGVIAVIAFVMLSVWLLVNPNHFKSKIAVAVREATGRDLVVDGDIKLSVFPWIALEFGPASLGNPAGFGGAPFVAVRHAAVRAKLLPLLQERLEIARVEIDGLDVRLQRNASGTGNWQGIGQRDARGGAEPAPVSVAAAVPTPISTQEASSVLQSLTGIKVTNARLSYENLTLQNFNLETASMADGMVPVSIRFDADRGVARERATVEVKVAVGNPGARRYRLAALSLTGQVFVAGNDRPLRWSVSTAALDVDLGAQTLAAPTFALAIAGAQLSGGVRGTNVVDDLSLTGSVTLAPLVLREFLPRWGVASPATQDPRALAVVSGSTVFAYGRNALRLDELRVAFDDTRLNGAVAVANVTTSAANFDLSLDKIDLDRYLAPEGKPVVSASAPAPVPQPGVAEGTTRPVEINGTLRVAALHWSRLDFTDLQVTLAAKDGMTRVFPLVAMVDGGRYSGDVTVDGRGSVPVLAMDEHLVGVDLGKLAAGNGKNIRLSGKGNFNVKAMGRGASSDALLRSLSGHVDGVINEGAVEGIDLGFELARAEALIKRQDAASAPDTHRTKFDVFKTSAEIVNGVAQTKDLTISSAVLRVTGQGSTNLATKAIDFQLVADTLRSTQGMSIQIPVKVTGTTADPSIRPDIEALAKGQLRQKLQDVLHDKLRGLFGKP